MTGVTILPFFQRGYWVGQKVHSGIATQCYRKTQTFWPSQYITSTILDGLPWWLSSKESTCLHKRHGFSPWIGKIPWRRNWQPTPVFLLGESHGLRSLVGYSARVAKNQTWLKWLSTSLFLTLWGNPVIQILPVTDQSSFLWLTFWANVLVSFREKKMFFLIIMTWHFPRNSIMMQTHSPSFLA